MDGWMEGWMDRWTDRWKDRQVEIMSTNTQFAFQLQNKLRTLPNVQAESAHVVYQKGWLV